MTAAHFDLGLRLAAHSLRRPVPRVAMQPVAALAPTVVFIKAAGRAVTVHTPTTTATVHGTDATLSALSSAGLGTADPASLVVEDAATRAFLNRAARSARPDHPDYPTAAHIGWSLGRADVSATSALIHLPRLLARTWALAVAPSQDLEPAVHRHWHGISDPGTQGMATLLTTVTALPPHPLLTQISKSDAADWNSVHTDLIAGRDWRQPDDRKRAAVGLAVRDAAAEVLDSAMLADRRARRLAVHLGNLAQGRVTATGPREFTLAVPRLDVRLRVGARLRGWAGPAGFDHPHPFACLLADTDTHGTTLLMHCTTRGRAPLPPVGAVATVIPGGQVSNVIAAARSTSALYNQRFSWLATGRTPTTHRRDVPLEVLVAAATDDPED